MRASGGGSRGRLRRGRRRPQIPRRRSSARDLNRHADTDGCRPQRQRVESEPLRYPQGQERRSSAFEAVDEHHERRERHGDGGERERAEAASTRGDRQENHGRPLRQRLPEASWSSQPRTVAPRRVLGTSCVPNASPTTFHAVTRSARRAEATSTWVLMTSVMSAPAAASASRMFSRHFCVCAT